MPRYIQPITNKTKLAILAELRKAGRPMCIREIAAALNKDKWFVNAFAAQLIRGRHVIVTNGERRWMLRPPGNKSWGERRKPMRYYHLPEWLEPKE